MTRVCFPICRIPTALLVIPLVLFTYSSFSQNTTRSEDPSLIKASNEKKRVLLIPFDPKMYMSDIDRSINRETKMNFKEIRDAFRSGIDFQLISQFKPAYSVISLLRDSVKSKKDLQFIYQSTGYKYTVTQGPEKPADQKNISKGQLTVPTRGEEERYMRTVINQPGLLEAMNKKYGAELFVFVSEIDLKAIVDPEGNPGREADIHFTVYDLNGKQLGGGLAKSKFNNEQNEPKRIVSHAFPSAAHEIYLRSIIPPAQTGGAASSPTPEKHK